MTKITFDGTKTFLHTKDKSVMQRLAMDFKGEREGDLIRFDLSSCNVLVITEDKVSKQGLYFQLNLEAIKKETTLPAKTTPQLKQTVKAIQSAVDVLHKNNIEVKPAKNIPLKQTEKAIRGDKTESIHHNPKETKTVIMRLKQKPKEKDLWSED